MIWNDIKLHWQCQEHALVSPYEPANVNPASIDLRLGDLIRQATPVGWTEPVPFENYLLSPGQFVLCHSLEYVQIPTSAAAILVLKSSMGRQGLNHLHSGWGDPGFGLGKGAQWTFELQNVAPWPIMLKAGQRIIQIVMMDLVAPPEVDYRQTGNYVYQTGPTIARSEQ
jgi:deoxycytidine triphosphate deaminase